MIGENWTNDQKRRLKEMSFDPVRNPPERLKSMVKYFRTPGASLFAITDGDGPLHATKKLARKVRDYQAEGALDWVMDETSGRPSQRYDAEWRDWLLSHAAEFSQAVDAYREELGRRIQCTELNLGLRATFMRPRVAYGPSHQPFVESIFSRDLKLSEVRRKFELALRKGDIAGARKLSEDVGVALVSRVAI